MIQNKFFKYVRNYFVRIPLSNMIPHFRPIMYGGGSVLVIIFSLTRYTTDMYTWTGKIVFTAILLLISLMLVPLILWFVNFMWLFTDAGKQAFSEFVHAIKGDDIVKNPGEEEFLCSLDAGNQPSSSSSLNSGSSWFKENKIMFVVISEEIDDQTGEALALPEPKQIYLPEGQDVDKGMLNNREVDMLYQGVMKYTAEVLKDYFIGEQLKIYVNNIFDLRQSTDPEYCARNLAVVSDKELLRNMSEPRKRLTKCDIYSLVANLRPLTKGDGVTYITLYLAYRQMFPGLFANVKEKSFAQNLSKTERYDSENHVIPNEVIPRLYQRTQNATIEYFVSLAKNAATES